MMKRILSVFLGLTLLLGIAAADSISVDGKVVVDRSVIVYAPIGGTVEEVKVSAGETVAADTVLMSLRTDKVYATEGGTVTGVFGEPGDSADTVAARYGALMYIEGEVLYTVAASTNNAYTNTETKVVHVGERVFLSCRSNARRNGHGVITTISGTDYTVEATDGNFIPGDSVDIFRSDSGDAKTRVGRGTVSRKSPTAVSATGSIVRYLVKDGDTVKRGDLLVETLTGTFDGLWMSGTDFTAGIAGVVGEVRADQGSAVQKDAAVAVIYPEGSMHIEAEIPEDSLGDIKAGDKVTIEASADESLRWTGTVRRISALATAGAAETTYTAVIDFTPDANVRYGMAVIVSTLEAEPAEMNEDAQ